ncbi:MAG: MATE family efflux transporter, partial [Treponema sp.]|nr:MATE family efflux transporter [Candidatus Treponema equi]
MNSPNSIYTKKSIYSQISKLAFPIALQNLLSACVNSVDVVMLNFVGQDAVAAVSLAAQYSFVLWCIYFGLGTGLTILGAQYYGKKDFKAIEAVEGIALRFTVIVGGLFFVGTFFFPQILMSWFSNDDKLILLGSQYMRIVSFSYLFNTVVEVYFSTLKSVSRVKASTVVNISANILNIVLNAAFIFGWCGLPKLGIAGVALATTISGFMRMICVFVLSALSPDVKIRLSMIFIKNKVLFQDFFKLSLPALLNDLIWGLAFSVYTGIMGHLNSDAVAAFSFVAIVRNFGQVLCFGVANGGGLFLGKVLGENNMEDGKIVASCIVKLTVVTGAIGGLIIFIASPLVLGFADLTSQAHDFLEKMLLINCFYVMGSAINTTFICG